MSNSPVIIGEITGVSGVKGWVKIFSYTEPRLNIVKYNPWLLRQREEWKAVRLISGRPQGKTIVAQIEGVNCPKQARRVIGSEIAIDPSQLKVLGKQDYYWRDLEGLRVLDLNDEMIGIVSHLIETGANDVLVVKASEQWGKKNESKEILVPYVIDSVIKNIDLDAESITVDWDDEYC